MCSITINKKPACKNLTARRPFFAPNRRHGFTLVELMIIVAILGILAALIVPEVQGHIQRAKESQAKANLKLLRDIIERYAADNNGIPPGYPLNKPNLNPNYPSFMAQLVVSGKYLKSLPKNPFNDSSVVLVLPNDTPYDPDGSYPDSVGWIYHPASKTIKLNKTGTDSEGVKYSDY